MGGGELLLRIRCGARARGTSSGPYKKGRKRGGRKKGRKEMGWEGGVWNASMRQEGG